MSVYVTKCVGLEYCVGWIFTFQILFQVQTLDSRLTESRTAHPHLPEVVVEFLLDAEK